MNSVAVLSIWGDSSGRRVLQHRADPNRSGLPERALADPIPITAARAFKPERGVAYYPAPYPDDIRFMDLRGHRYGRLLVVEFAGRSPYADKAVWLCLCDCGVTTYVKGETMRQKKHPVISCGCWRMEKIRVAATTHGLSKTTEYRIWTGMIDRCESPGATKFHRYGARGISVCPRWRESFEAFLADMGPRPSGDLSVERRNNDGDYEPGNCVWATRKTQCRNRWNNHHVEFRGRKVTVAEAAEALGMKPLTLLARLRAGWSDYDATSLPVEQHKGNKPRVGRTN